MIDKDKLKIGDLLWVSDGIIRLQLPIIGLTKDKIGVAFLFDERFRDIIMNGDVLEKVIINRKWIDEYNIDEKYLGRVGLIFAFANSLTSLIIL